MAIGFSIRTNLPCNLHVRVSIVLCRHHHNVDHNSKVASRHTIFSVPRSLFVRLSRNNIPSPTVSDSRLAEVERERDDVVAQLEQSEARARRNDEVATSVVTKLTSRVSELERERGRQADDLTALRTRAAADAAARESLTEQVASLSKALDAATAAAAAVEAEAGLANKLQAELRAERTARQDAETLVTAFKAKASQNGADRRSVADAERVAIETIERFHIVEASLTAERDVSSRLHRELKNESERRAKLDDENRTLRARCDRCLVLFCIELSRSCVGVDEDL